MTKAELKAFREWRKKAIERHEKRPLIAMFKAMDDAKRKANQR